MHCGCRETGRELADWTTRTKTRPQRIRYSRPAADSSYDLQALEGKNVVDMLSNVGAGGSAPAASSAPAAAAAGGDAPAAEKAVEKVEEKEESDDDMVSFSLSTTNPPLSLDARKALRIVPPADLILTTARYCRVSGSSINQPIYWKLISCAIHLRFTVRRTGLHGESDGPLLYQRSDVQLLPRRGAKP